MMSIKTADISLVAEVERLMSDTRWGETLDARNPCPEAIASSGRRLLSRSCRGRFVLGIMLLALLNAWSPWFGQGRPVSIQSRPDVLNIGYIQYTFYDLQMNDARVALEMWASSLINQDESPLKEVDALIFPSVADLQIAISNEKLDIIILGSAEYLRLRNRDLIEPVLAPNSYNSCLQNYILLIRKDSGINELAQLRNGRLLLVLGGEGELPKVWLETLFLKEGLGNATAFFKEIKPVEKASKAVLPVFFRQADVCLATSRSFDSLKELNPQIGNELVALRISPNLLRGLVCFRKSRTEKDKKRTLDSMLRMHEDPPGKQIMLLFREERLVPFQDAYLESAKNLLLEFEKLGSKYASQIKESHR